MELEMEVLFNDTDSTSYNDTDYESVYKRTFHDSLYTIAEQLTFCVNVAFDLFLMYILYKNRIVWNRMYKFLFCIILYDCMSVPIPEFMWVAGKFKLDTILERLLFCVCLRTSFMFKYCSYIFVGLIISNSCIKSTRFTDKFVIIAVNVLLLMTLIINTILCSFKISLHVTFQLGIVMFVCLAITLIVKELNILRKAKTDPISKETLHRINIGRIMVYNLWIVLILTIIFEGVGGNKIILWISISSQLSGVYLFIYLFHADKIIRISVLNICRKQARPYEADATINFVGGSQPSPSASVVNVNPNNH